MFAPIRTPAEIAAIFRAPPDRVRAALQQNAAQLRKMAEKAERTGKKVNGYTAEMLNERAFKTAMQALL